MNKNFGFSYTKEELEDVAVNWQKDTGDYETPLSEYFVNKFIIGLITNGG